MNKETTSDMKKIFFKMLLLAWLATLGYCHAEGVLAEVRVVTKNGSLVGEAADGSGILSFKGVRYAQPPVGDLRWKAPQPLNYSSKDWISKKYGNKCWAAPIFGGPIVTDGVSEDCLFLNIWSSSAGGQKKPVMVFIHGGGFQYGSASDEEKDGISLAKRGAVVVTINYRLGIFGFMSLSELDHESSNGNSGMYGILDQIAALRWVRENIEAFGGDPENVTIFGESAGAHSVGILMSTPLAAGLFHKAIGQSGAFWESENGDMKSKSYVQNLGNLVLKKLRVTNLEQLRKITALELQKTTSWSLATDPSVENFSPHVDGFVLTDTPYIKFASGTQNDVPLLVGWNGNEGEMFLPRGLPREKEIDFISGAQKVFGDASMPDFQKIYPAYPNDQLAKSAELLIGDQAISFQTWTWANVHRKTGKSSVYVYYFNHSSKYTPKPLHTTDVPYVFGNLPPKKNIVADHEDLKISESMQKFWVNFARTGDPNGFDLEYWPKYEGAGTSVMQFAEKIHSAPEVGTERFEFLKNFRKDGKLIFGNILTYR